jgi:hypothetical protein
MTTYFEIRWAPESYYPGLRVATRELADAVVAEIARRVPRLMEETSEVEIHEITVQDGTPAELAVACLAAWGELTEEFDLIGYAPYPIDDDFDEVAWKKAVLTP